MKRRPERLLGQVRGAIQSGWEQGACACVQGSCRRLWAAAETGGAGPVRPGTLHRTPTWEPVHTKSWPDTLVNRPGRLVGPLPVSLHDMSIRIQLLALSLQQECCLLWDSPYKSLPFPRSVLQPCRLSPGKEDWLQSGIPTLDHSYTARPRPFGIPVAHRPIRPLAESDPE